MRGLANGLALLKCAGGSFGLDISYYLRLLAVDEIGGFNVAINFAPRFFEANDVAALAARHLGQPVGEKSVGEYRDFGPGLGEIRNGGFHAGATGAGNRNGEFVLSAEGDAQHLLDVADDFQAVR